MNMKLFVVSLLTLIVISGCARREEDDSTSIVTDANQVIDPGKQEIVEQQPPNATIAAVNVQITLTPAAEALLKSKSEKIMIIAAYSGDPQNSKEAQSLSDASGMIKLGENKKTIDTAASVTFEEDVIDKSLLNQIVGEVQLTINVISSKTMTPENLLACPFYWETLADASKGTVKIDCKAISEIN